MTLSLCCWRSLIGSNCQLLLWFFCHLNCLTFGYYVLSPRSQPFSCPFASCTAAAAVGDLLYCSWMSKSSRSRAPPTQEVATNQPRYLEKQTFNSLMMTLDVKGTVFENHRKSLIQHCESEWTKVLLKCQKWSILASFWKSETCGQTVLPDTSILKGQKNDGKCQNSKTQMRHIGWFSNSVSCTRRRVAMAP